MAEKPILFSTEMVRAILDGRKMQTRRIIKPQPKTIERDPKKRVPEAFWVDNQRWIKPPYQSGDILWMRETWQHFCLNRNTIPNRFAGHSDYCYRSTVGNDCCGEGGCKKWRPSIHMPREAARLFLTVKNVRVERVQDITPFDCRAEGILFRPFNGAFPHFEEWLIKDYHTLWDSIYSEPIPLYEDEKIVSYYSCPWEDVQETCIFKGKPWVIYSNPWVWVTEFEMLTAHE